MLLPKPALQLIPGCFRRRIIGDAESAFRHLLILLISFAAGNFPHGKAISGKERIKFALFVRCKVIANNAYRFRVEFSRFQETVKLFPHRLVGIKPAFAHNRIHVAVSKVNIRKFFPKVPVNKRKVTADKVVDTTRKDKNGRRLFRQLSDNVRDTVENQLFHIAAQHVFLPHRNCGKAVRDAHLGGSQHNTAQTSLCTDKNLVRTRNQHPGMDNVPGSACRRRVFQSRQKRRRETGIRNPHRDSGNFRPLGAGTFQHGFPPQACRIFPASVRYSSAILLCGNASITVLPSSSAERTVSLRSSAPITEV